MPKKRSKNPDEYYRGQIRELQKENRQLQKRIRQLEKSEHVFEAMLDEEPIEYDVTPLQKLCLDCGKGKIKEINILDRIFEECSVCDYRRKVKGP